MFFFLNSDLTLRRAETDAFTELFTLEIIFPC